MLLNEFLKEHKTVEEEQTTIRQLKSQAAGQEQTISALRKEMGVLTAQVKEQAAQIQKVSTRDRDEAIGGPISDQSLTPASQLAWL